VATAPNLRIYEFDQILLHSVQGKTEFICYVRLTCLKVKIMLYERATTVGVHAIRRRIEKLWLVAIATIFYKILKK